jgi:hypothetical protein
MSRLFRDEYYVMALTTLVIFMFICSASILGETYAPMGASSQIVDLAY